MRHVVRSLLVLAISAVLVSGIQAKERPSGTEYILKSGDRNWKSLWVPDGVDIIRGIIMTGTHGDGDAWYRDSWYHGVDTIGIRTLCKRQKLAVMKYYGSFNIKTPESSTAYLLGPALDSLARMSGHPEIKYTNVFVTGHSAGGWDACAFSRYHPDRTLGIFPVAGFWEVIVDSAASRAVPCLGVNQGSDYYFPGSGVNTLDDIQKGRQSLAPWTWCFTDHVAHHCIEKQRFTVVWLEEIAKARIPQSVPVDKYFQPLALVEQNGWLGKWWGTDNGYDNGYDGAGAAFVTDSAKVWSYANCPYDPKECFWFPSQRCAEAWQIYMTNLSQLPESWIWFDATSLAQGFKIYKNNAATDRLNNIHEMADVFVSLTGRRIAPDFTSRGVLPCGVFITKRGGNGRAENRTVLNNLQ
jgi:hypothetical protein